jgi:hypothetical protein
MKVIVKQGLVENFIGFFDHIRRRPGDRFSIPDVPRRALFPGEKRAVDAGGEEADVYNQIKDRDGKIPQGFSFKWMEPAPAGAQDRVSTSQQALDKRSADIKAEKAGQRALDAGDEGDGNAADRDADII